MTNEICPKCGQQTVYLDAVQLSKKCYRCGYTGQPVPAGRPWNQ